MEQRTVALLLVFLFALYSSWIYTNGTEKNVLLAGNEQAMSKMGKALFQKHNCQSCHQLYGLGGYLGPDLTSAWSDKNRGETYIKALLQSGGNRMPDFDLTKEEIDQLITYLKYVDSTAAPLQTASSH